MVARTQDTYKSAQKTILAVSRLLIIMAPNFQQTSKLLDFTNYRNYMTAVWSHFSDQVVKRVAQFRQPASGKRDREDAEQRKNKFKRGKCCNGKQLTAIDKKLVRWKEEGDSSAYFLLMYVAPAGAPAFIPKGPAHFGLSHGRSKPNLTSSPFEFLSTPSSSHIQRRHKSSTSSTRLTVL